jgi:hypothetical protein
MNLNQIVSGAISSVNPMVTATLRASTGSTTNPDGTRVPTYAAPVAVQCQIQSLQYQDILKLAGLAIQGVRNKVYLDGDWQGLVRADRRGGDLLTMPDGSIYLVALILESWPDWTCAAVTMQDNA